MIKHSDQVKKDCFRCWNDRSKYLKRAERKSIRMGQALKSSSESKADDFVQPYSPMVYNTVTTSLKAALKKLEDKDATPFLFTQVRDCFLKHGVEKTFSAFLIHKHFDLAANERNVEMNGKAIASSDLDGILPSSWIYHDSKCYPVRIQPYNLQRC